MQTIQGNSVFYFTGTGGCLAAAKRICAEMPDFQPVPIAALAGETSITVDAEAVGLVFPLYFAGLPNIVLNFVQNVVFNKPCYLFAVVACGVPWSGYALHQLKGQLAKKKQKLSAGFYLKMVDNYLPHYTMPTAEEQAPFYLNVDTKLANIIECLKARRKIVEHERGLLLYPSHPIFMPKLKRYDRFYTVDGSCNSCGVCQSVCPISNIDLEGGKPVWKHECEFCMACIQYCPKQAIQWKNITQSKSRYHYKGIGAGDIAKQKNWGNI